MFEKAFYQTIQKTDESNDSYLARHDASFEDMMAKGVSMEEVRAYVMVRQSQLNSEDRKRIVVETEGNLTYAGARKSLRLLGSRFFQDLQGTSKAGKYRTYDVNTVDNLDEAALWTTEAEAFDEEAMVQALHDAGDEDATFIMDFEDTVIEAVQESPELASCYHTYMEARTRLRERAKYRGFWSPSALGKGKGKKGKGAMNKGFGVSRPKSLAERIATSACRKCGQVGHWKKECPLTNAKGDNKGKTSSPDSITLAEALVTYPTGMETLSTHIEELPTQLPENAVDIGQQDTVRKGVEHVFLGESFESMSASKSFTVPKCFRKDPPKESQMFQNSVETMMHGRLKLSKKMNKGFHQNFEKGLRVRLQSCCRKHGRMILPETSAVTSPRDPFFPSDHFGSVNDPAAVFYSHEERAHEAVIDTGASRSVIGAERVEGLVDSIVRKTSCQIKRVPSTVQFRFGNSGTLQSEYAICIPRQQKGWIRVEVVPGRTPFLVSNTVLKEIGALIDPRNQQMRFLENDMVIPLGTCRKNLLCVDVVALLNVEGSRDGREEIYHTKETPQTPSQRGFDEKYDEDSRDKTNGIDPPLPFSPPFCMKEMPENHVQKKPPFEGNAELTYTNSRAPLVAQVTNSDHQPRDSVVSHEHPSRPEVSSGRALGGGGCQPHHRRDLLPETREIQGSTRNSNIVRVGATSDSQWETSRKDFREGIHGGRWISDADQESKGVIGMDAQFSELPEGHVGSSSSPSTSRTSDPEQSTEGQDTAHSRRYGKCLKDSIDINSGRGLGEGGSQQNRSEEQERELRGEGRHIDKNDNGAQPGESREDSDADCDLAARTGSGNTSTRRSVKASKKGPKKPEDPESQHLELLTESQVMFLHNEISKRMCEIQGGLSNLKQKHPAVASIHPKPVPYSRPVDLLEVYCEKESQITQQINRCGGNAIRFTREDGDLSTDEGINKLWTWVEMYEPKHIWVAPECRLWGSFSRFNMGRSMDLQNSILNQRKRDLCHLTLCHNLYLHQVAHGRHFHLEQPVGSEMTKQPQLHDVVTGTLPAFFDMCQAGGLKTPNSEAFLQKRTQVWTTSRELHKMLHGRNCPGNHLHHPIKGNVKGKDHKWVRLSAYAAAYTAVFARRVAQAVLYINQGSEKPLLFEELLVGEDIEIRGGAPKRPLAQSILELRKCRRRHDGKGPPTEADKAAHVGCDERECDENAWKGVVALFEKGAPRVGNSLCWVGDPKIERLQQLVPHVDVQLVITCRGTERHRVPGIQISRENIPPRKTIYVHRTTGQIVDMGEFEEWEKLSKAKQTRKAGPARISLSIFGRPIVFEAERGVGRGVVSFDLRNGEEKAVQENPGQENPLPPVNTLNLASKDGAVQLPLVEMEKGWPPKIVPVHGPAFLRLDSERRSDLMRLHHNLGHPDPSRLQRLLEAQGADPQVIAGALDMQCDVCLETQPKPKLPHPATIHENLDFNDVVGADGAHWTSSLGQSYHFMHFIDEGTLYHTGMLSGRSTEEQITTFEQAWLQWAGPCKTLYLDPAGEYVSSKWNQYLQGENIRVVMAAGDSHWQIGRAEIHGKIVKDMLTRMDREDPIKDVKDFQKCLRQVFAAKNSLSRARGFTPEQALLGKARSLPASLTSDNDGGAHALAESETPEGLHFRESLMRREQALRAFIQADNDSACRRALLRRSRPGSVEFEKGDWVLYWKKLQGNPRGAKGRWHGPAQVITVEQKRVVWLSHGGYLIRASPQHLRPASLREYHALPKDSSGRVLDETVSPQARNFHALTDVPPIDEASMYEPSIAPTEDLRTNDQPEQEISPPISVEGETPKHEDEIPSNELAPGDLGGLGIPIPDDENEESLCAFGDDVILEPQKPGVWEVNLGEEVDIPHHEEVAEKDFAEFILLATSAKKQRIEVQRRNLNDHDRQLFTQAKAKEVGAWLEHGTVKRLAKGSLPPNRNHAL